MEKVVSHRGSNETKTTNATGNRVETIIQATKQKQQKLNCRIQYTYVVLVLGKFIKIWRRKLYIEVSFLTLESTWYLNKFLSETIPLKKVAIFVFLLKDMYTLKFSNKLYYLEKNSKNTIHQHIFFALKFAVFQRLKPSWLAIDSWLNPPYCSLFPCILSLCKTITF